MEQLTPLLEKLAQKLGTTTEYLWQVLIKQASIEVVVYLIWLTGTIIMIAINIKIFRWLNKNWDEVERRNQDFTYSVLACLFGFIGLVGIMVVLFNIGNLVSALFNPEYWALKEVLSYLK